MGKQSCRQVPTPVGQNTVTQLQWHPLDYIVKCNNQMMVAAGGNGALRL